MRTAEEEEQVAERAETSREDEDEDEDEMVNDMVLVFFCTLWTCAMFQAYQEAVTQVVFTLCLAFSQQDHKKSMY